MKKNTKRIAILAGTIVALFLTYFVTAVIGIALFPNVVGTCTTVVRIVALVVFLVVTCRVFWGAVQDRRKNSHPVPDSAQDVAPDVFISYRRATGREAARTLQLALEARGYSVFFDYDSLQDGVFNQAIFKAIEECKVVIAFLSDGSLDRCANAGDWVRTELEHALAQKKKIVPVAPTDAYNRWQWPATLPASLSALSAINISELHTGSLFRESVDKIITARFGFHPGES